MNTQEMLKNELAKVCMYTGAQKMRASSVLLEDAVNSVRYALVGKPADVTEEQIALMGVAIGLALQESEAKIEQLGGFDSALKILQDEGIEGVLKRANQ